MQYFIKVCFLSFALGVPLGSLAADADTTRDDFLRELDGLLEQMSFEAGFDVWSEPGRREWRVTQDMLAAQVRHTMEEAEYESIRDRRMDMYAAAQSYQAEGSEALLSGTCIDLPAHRSTPDLRQSAFVGIGLPGTFAGLSSSQNQRSESPRPSREINLKCGAGEGALSWVRLQFYSIRQGYAHMRQRVYAVLILLYACPSPGTARLFLECFHSSTFPGVSVSSPAFTKLFPQSIIFMGGIL